MSYSLNALAYAIIENEILPNQDALNVRAYPMKNGSTVIDMGLNEKGGFMAARLFTNTCMGGLGQLEYRTMDINGHLCPVAAITVDRPVISELAAHDAFLKVPYRGNVVTVSGPIRSITGTDKFARATGYYDKDAKYAVCHIQTTVLPTEELTELIAQSVGMSPKSLYVLVAKTGTLTGAAQVSARNVEQSLPSLLDHGFPVDSIVQACGYAPIVSVVDDENVAYGRVNDGLIYGQETNLYVRCLDSDIEAVLDILPFNKNKDVYGVPFQELFARCSNEWHLVPREWDAPCRVNFFNMSTNNVYCAGALHYGVLEGSFLGGNK